MNHQPKSRKCKSGFGFYVDAAPEAWCRPEAVKSAERVVSTGFFTMPP
jgi:hypothetical protein